MKGLLVKEAAKILGVHENTVRNLERQGILRAQRDWHGYRRFDFAEVIHLKKEREEFRPCQEAEA